MISKESIATGRGEGGLTRRDFVKTAALAVAGAAAGCATNPATGRRQLMFFGQGSEVQWDREASPHQFSADFGEVRDPALNAYVDRVAQGIVPHTHRPAMPYHCRCVNASYVNAYTFPAGSMAVTRGILLNLETEDQLAALLGHEVAHVTARHTAQRMTQAMLVQGALVLTALMLDRGDEPSASTPWVLGFGMIGAGLLLARYSRKHEAQADRFGMEYLVKAGYNPDGMVGLMAVLKTLQSEKPWLLLRLFSSHPWSGDRYDDAVRRSEIRYADARSRPVLRERYMDATASVRRAKPVIEAIQKGDDLTAEGNLAGARARYDEALKAMADDYEALLKIANNCLERNKPRDALGFSMEAKGVYPAEPQAVHMCGMARLGLRRFDEALREFDEYAERLPGNPYTGYYQGRSMEGLARRSDAAEKYQQFLSQVPAGEEADHARARLEEWGYAEIGSAAGYPASSTASA